MKTKPEKKIKIKRKRKRIYETGIEEESVKDNIATTDLNGESKSKEIKNDEVKRIKADMIVKNYMLLSIGVCTIPVPVIDIVAVMGFQIKMLHKLSGLYKIEFSQSRGKSIIASLIGSIAPIEISKGLAGILFKSVPAVGPIISFSALSILAGASTYAAGKIFIQHFESGGTFLNFDPAKVKKYYKEQYLKGKKISSKAKTGNNAFSKI